MKKIKLLLPIAIAASTAGIVIPLASCSCSKVETEDTKNVKKINEVLETAKPTTMSEVVATLKEKEIDIETLAPLTSGNQYVWDSKANKMFIMDSEGKAAVAPDGYVIDSNESNIWKMVRLSSTTKALANNTNEVHVDAFSKTSPYSQYLRSDSVAPTTGTIEFCSGIDTGDIKDLTLKLVTGTKQVTDPVIINTNGGLLTIESTSLSTIEHYGILKDLSVNTCKDGGSISTTGEIGSVIIADNVKTSFVAEKESVVNTVYVADVNTKIEVKSENVGTVVPTTDTAAAAIEEIVDDSSVPEESKPTKEDEKQPAPDPTSDELTGLGTERSPYVVTCKKDFIKIHEYSETKGYCHYVFESTTKEIDGSDWETNGYYGNLYGTFDGNGLVVNNLSRPLFNVVGRADSTTEVMKISNVTLNCDITLPSSTAGVVRSLDRNAIFENVDMHGYVSGAVHVGGYVCYGPGNIHDDYTQQASNWQFINCHSDAMISGTGNNPYVSAFVAHRFSNDDSVYTFKDSVFTGVLNGTADFTEGDTSCCYSYFVTAPAEYCFKVRTSYSTEFITKYGNPENVKYKLPTQTFEETVEGTTYKCFYNGIDAALPKQAPDYEAKKDKYVRTGYIASGMRNKITLVTQAITEAQVTTLQVEKQTGAQLAYASLFIGPNGKATADVNLLKSFESETCQEEQSGQTTIYKSSTIKNFNVYVNDPSHTTPGIQGDDYVIYDTATYRQTATPEKYILMIQYKPDNGGRLIPFYTTKFTW